MCCLQTTIDRSNWLIISSTIFTYLDFPARFCPEPAFHVTFVRHAQFQMSAMDAYLRGLAMLWQIGVPGTYKVGSGSIQQNLGGLRPN